MKEKIIKALAEVTGLSQEEIHLEIPENVQFGDYSSNIAMIVFANEKRKTKNEKCKSPRDLAQSIAEKLEKDRSLSKLVDHIDVASPGFINFWLKKDTLLDNLIQIDNERENYGRSNTCIGKRIMFEFGQPNTHKIPHIGHLFSYIYGSVMSNILEMAGNTIFRANYQGDIGLHVAKCLWAFKKENSQTPDKLEEKVDLLQKMYQMGSKYYDEDEKAKEEINKLNRAIYDRDQSIEPLWKETRSWSVEYYKKFEERLGIKFDRYYFESEVYEKGKEIVVQNLGKVFKESEEAVIFEGSKFGLHDRVFLTKYETPTYEAKDMYLQILKYQEWPFDLLIITTASEQNEYFKVIFKALEEFNHELKSKLMHIGFGMVNLKTGKMASRTGEFIGGIELVDKVVDAIGDIVSGREDLNPEEKDKICEMVGIGAVKYSFLKNNPLQDIKFDINESISKEGNSGPYLQYTYARTQSVLRKAEGLKQKAKINFSLSIKHLAFNFEELSLLRTLVHFPEIIEEAAKNYSPNLVCNYLYDLASKFNLFYNLHRIVDVIGKTKKKQDNKSIFRLALTSATGQILKNGLYLLGIQTPQKM